MKLHTLLEALSGWDPDLDVTVDGYEGGYTESISPRVITVVIDANKRGIYGEHDDPSTVHAGKPTKQVLNLSRIDYD